MTELAPNAALILVDVQQGFSETAYFGGNRNNPHAEVHIKQILEAWRASQRPIYHIKHNSTEPNSPLRPNQIGNEFMPEVTPQNHEPVIGKTVNSAFIGTDLEKRLRDNDIEQVVIVGLTTNHCVSTTTRMAGNLGFDTYLVADATATFDRTGIDGTVFPAQIIHDTAIANLHQEFATILQTDALLKILAS